MEEKKFTTAYCHFFKKPNNINKISMCGRVRHIVVAGDGGSCTAYELSNKDVTCLNENKYNSLHPEADTAVFYSLKVFLEQHGDQVSGSTVIIHCPETDCVNVVLYKYSQIKIIVEWQKN